MVEVRMGVQRRVLDKRTHGAQVQHHCETCDHAIFPGDLYEVTVEVITNGRYRYLRVRKEHVSPNCPYDPNDDLDEQDRLICEPLELPLAA
jgi:hypothetical protein